MGTEEINIDVFIGNKIRERRKLLKLNQSDLADLLNLSYQQIQRYESGENTVTVNRLIQLAQALNVSPGYFYEGAPLNTQVGQRVDSGIIVKNLLRPLRVLCIDDNPNDVILFRNAANKYDSHIEIHTINESDKVLDFLLHHKTKHGKERPDLIMLDINLPKINGLTLLQQIKSNVQIAGIPIVMLTNSISAKEMHESYANHASGFIQKSTDLDTYYEDIRRALAYWWHTVVLPVSQV